MNITICCRRYCPGEAWTNRILGYAKGLSELGFHVNLIFLIPDKKRSSYSLKFNNVTIINLWKNDGFFAKHFRIISYFKNLLRLKNYIKKDDYVFVYGGDLTILFVAKTLKAFIYSEITEHPFYNIYQRSFFSKIFFKIFILFKLRFLNRLDGLCVISQSLRNFFISNGFPENKICVSNMFVDASRFNCNDRKSDLKYIAYCGILSYNKDGVDLLIKSFSIFHKEFPDYKLLLIGRGESNKILKNLKQLCSQLNLSDSVIFTGAIAPKEIPPLLISAKILVLNRPIGIQSENGFPTKLGEYLATGNPVLVTSVGEIPNFIIDGNNGFLSKPNDFIEFGNKLIFIINNYDYAKVVGSRGKLLVNKEFSYLSQTKVLLDLMLK